MTGRFVWRDLGPRYRGGRMWVIGGFKREPGTLLDVLLDCIGRRWWCNATTWPR